MDRAHRLGQTRQVTVYRLITKGTIDERIIQLARVKKDVRLLLRDHLWCLTCFLTGSRHRCREQELHRCDKAKRDCPAPS